MQYSSEPSYSIRIESSGDRFQKTVVKDLKLDVASTVAENAPLKLGSVTQEVDVTGGMQLVDTTTASVLQVIDNKTVQDIPLNGRHFVNLVYQNGDFGSARHLPSGLKPIF